MPHSAAIRLFVDSRSPGLAYDFRVGEDLASGPAGPDRSDTPDYGAPDDPTHLDDLDDAVDALGDLVLGLYQAGRGADGLLAAVVVSDVTAACRILERL